ncbi:MAG TPA: PilC/PilY family type IV pilus protein [Steroidobacteraceae bacterium]|jgi:type IV pilus assembly protein PilY1|nr:PilC/PilY family type IV pilus protein [Steroidobacteraceae bacterium]
MRGNRIWILALAIAGLALHCSPGFAQAIVSEDFTGTTTTNPWYYFNGACLTASKSAGTGTSGVTPGVVPGCTTLQNYYDSSTYSTSDSALVGGYHGTATGSTAWNSATALDPSGNGALRFTNGCISGSSCQNGGHNENGLIVSGNTYSTDQGLDITFKTVTYRGDSGGNSAGCPSGSSANSGQCTSTTTTNATTTNSCPSGYTVSGGNCVATTPPTITYSCTSGWTLSGTTCTKPGHTTTNASASYSCPSGYTKSGSGSTTKCTETTSLSQTYSCPSGYTLSGTSCTETSVVDATDPHQTDGADGMSFFLMDGSQPVSFNSGAVGNYGSWGGSLGYTCSNSNTPYNGLVGGYIGLGIDEYGNFLNGTQNTLGVTNPQAMGDNTASGGGQWANRIGLRGAGNVSWYWLNANYPNYYPSSLTASQQNTAVQSTCETGTLWNYSVPASPSNTGATSAAVSGVTGPTLYDYTAISGGYVVLPASVQIANEYSTGGYSRQPYSTTSGTYGTGANPITYDLKITSNGLLSLSYSYNGGAWTSVIKDQSIANSNITMPATVRFGFAGSTGGSSNIHEVLCFKAAAASQAASSTTVNQQQSSKVENGSQAYFGYYDPQNWTGSLTANSLINTAGVLTIATSANWDGSCELTGIANGATCATTGQAGPVAAQPWTNGAGGRTILTWSGTAGIPFEWANLTSTEQSALDAGDSTQTADRLQFLRGDPAEQIQNGGVYRNLDSVLADIVDSSSSWVGPPSKSVYTAYETPATWLDKLYPSTTMAENSGQTYSSYVTAEATRQNVVYVGADDGFVHGFSAGAFDSTGTVYNSATNTGQEMLAYMPQGVLGTIHSASNSYLDYANPQYGHDFFVDATPATGDLYYSGTWHTWVVGGLGAGGSEIYALDVTTPANFTETNASSLVIGDWQGGTSATTNPGSFTCQNAANCALSLGNTYGTPTIRRMHNGDWALIFGNGLNSSTGDAGIFILTINPSSGSKRVYYLSTGKANTSDGIAYAHPVDMDQDHVVDYIYAGDVLGNVWRFDVTSSDPNAWAVTPGPLFTTPSQPITSDVFPIFVQGTAGVQLMLFFGTGEKFPLTQSTATTYATGQQSFYGIWDWNMSGWDANNSTQFASMPAGTITTMGTSNLQQQTVSLDAGLPSIDTPYMVCWAGTTTCSAATLSAHTSAVSSNSQYGWYINLPGSNSGYGSNTNEQVIYNPIEVTTAIQFNTILPAIDSPLACTPDQDQGWSYALNVQNGNPVLGFFVNNGNTHTIALQTNAAGSSTEVTTTNADGSPANTYLIFQSTSGGAAPPLPVHPGNNVSGARETWIQLR